MVKLGSVLALCAAFCVGSAVATPTPTTSTKKLIPGPGFPSLEELGITEADLAYAPMEDHTYNFEADKTQAAATATTTPTCVDEHQCKVQDSNYCINYLRHIGNQNCTVHGKVELETVEYGTAKIYLGQRQFGTGTILCKYVAQYAANVRKTCKKSGLVSGTQPFPKQLYHARGYKKDNEVLFVDLREYNGTASRV